MLSHEFYSSDDGSETTASDSLGRSAEWYVINLTRHF